MNKHRLAAASAAAAIVAVSTMGVAHAADAPAKTERITSTQLHANLAKAVAQEEGQQAASILWPPIGIFFDKTV